MADWTGGLKPPVHGARERQVLDLLDASPHADSPPAHRWLPANGRKAGRSPRGRKDLGCGGRPSYCLSDRPIIVNIPKRCDVVVIGGGPAVSTTATLLRQKGYSVALFDRAKHPRYKVGESMIPHFWKYCELSGVDQKIDAEGFIQKAGGTVVWNGVIRQMQFKDFGYVRPALHVERDRFDQILLEHARECGTQVYEEVAVLGADFAVGDSVTVNYRRTGEGTCDLIRCCFVVDASGQDAVIARQLGVRVIDDGFRFMSIWGYFKDSKYVAADGRAYPFECLRSVHPTTF